MNLANTTGTIDPRTITTDYQIGDIVMFKVFTRKEGIIGESSAKPTKQQKMGVYQIGRIEHIVINLNVVTATNNGIAYMIEDPFNGWVGVVDSEIVKKMEKTPSNINW